MNTPFWIAVWIILLESLILAIIIPGDWTESVIEKESELVSKRLGEADHQWIHDKANKWYQNTYIDTGIYDAMLDHVTPNDEQKAKSKGMENMGTIWFDWISDRIDSMSFTYYHMLTRLALLLTWLPYFILLFIPAVIDGVMTRQIKKTNFQYASPFFHTYATKGIIFITLVLITLFLAPIVIEPSIIPVSIMIVCVLMGLMVGNLQKRI